MREVILLNFGNTSNFISTHFWNLNDETFKTEDKFKTDNSVLYNDYNYPRNLIFDYSENIRPYFMVNEKISERKKKELQEDVQNQNKSNEIKKYEMDCRKSSKFVDLINDFNIDEEEYSQYMKDYSNDNDDDNSNTYNKYNSSNDKYEKQEHKLDPSEIYRLPDDKIYDYLDFQHSVKNWNDFLQPRFNKRSFNEIMACDVDLSSRGSYIKGHNFLHSENFNYFYGEVFEDNFRKFLEDCDKIELLHLNVDFNSFWGGVSNNMLDDIDQMCPKVLKMFYGTDLHSSFYNRDDSFNVEKLINYLWYFTDLNAHRDSNCMFMPIFKQENPSFIKSTFGYSFKPDENGNDPVYDYYYSALCGANLHNLHMPLKSKYFNNSSIIRNLIHTTNSNVNFIESDTIFALDNEVQIQNLKNNGIMCNFSRNTKAKDFSWKILYENSYKLHKFNSTIIHGFNERFVLLGQKIDGFLQKHSVINYTSIDRLDLPLSFPRKIYTSPNSKEIFLPDLSIMTNYRPFVEFPLKNLGFFPHYFKDFDLEIRKYLVNHDSAKYVEFKEKIEEYYKLIDSYEFINHNWDLRITGVDNSDEEND